MPIRGLIKLPRVGGLKGLIAAAFFVALPTLASAEQDGPAEQPTPKATLEDVQRFEQWIVADKYKLQSYCDLGKLQAEIDKAEEKNDAEAIDALVAKADGLEERLGSEYERITDELRQLNTDSAEAQKFATVFKAIEKECK